LQVKIEFAPSYKLSVIFRPISLVYVGHNIIFIFKLFIASATQQMVDENYTENVTENDIGNETDQEVVSSNEIIDPETTY
jgi:hypothetical protein